MSVIYNASKESKSQGIKVKTTNLWKYIGIILVQWQTCQSSDTLIWFIIFRNVGCAFCLHEINTTALRPFMRRVETFQDNMLILSYHVTLLDTGQNSTSVDVKLTPLNWRPALYSWQKRVFPAELHQLCVNNQALTCGVKPCNWSDTSKRRLAPSPSGKTLHASNKTDKGGVCSCTCIYTDMHCHVQWVRR